MNLEKNNTLIDIRMYNLIYFFYYMGEGEDFMKEMEGDKEMNIIDISEADIYTIKTNGFICKNIKGTKIIVKINYWSIGKPTPGLRGERGE